MIFYNLEEKTYKKKDFICTNYNMLITGIGHVVKKLWFYLIKTQYLNVIFKSIKNIKVKFIIMHQI